ncbi:MAG: S8 family serine peptidase, partial [Elusimicrobia bacterium]|nr:S8 family serine peptidase [Elusimicrobiota bacterium]
PAPGATLTAFAPASQDVIRKAAGLIDVSFGNQGEPLAAASTAAPARAPLTLEQARRVLTFLSKLDPLDPGQGMAQALRSYLQPRMPANQLDDNVFLKPGPDGRPALTAQGRRALLDILLASDGQLIEPMPADPKTPKLQTAQVPGSPAGSLASMGRVAAAAPRAALADPSAAFDGAQHRLGSFDWTSLDAAAAVPAGGLQSFDASKRLAGYSYDAQKGTVRVLVAADRDVAKDRLQSVKDAGAVYRETGLDQKLFESHGATVVRAFDNLVAVDVPLPQAAALGLALEKEGIESRPARVFKASMAALTSPVGAALGTGLLPIPSPATTKAIASLLPGQSDVRTQLDSAALDKAGMRGRGTLVGLIDSGVDADHPDLKGRVAEYMDFTGEGKADVVGHGTHVAGTIGGTGAASDGEYRGMADQTRFKVAKVFGTKGDTDESVILAAMKWMAGGDKNGQRVDILNMSLGGPGDPNTDPLSAMANHLTVDDHVLVVAAAGNEGPWTSSVGSPGNARYALTVGGVNHQNAVAFFSSRGPVVDSMGRPLYGKPDVLAVSGDVDLSKVAPVVAKNGTDSKTSPAAGLAAFQPAKPTQDSCIYSPGVIAPRSSTDPDKACTVAGNPDYRYMSGTSMAAPEVAGVADDVVGYLKSQGVVVDPFEVKAVIMETARTLPKESKDAQGAGLLDGAPLVQAVVERVRQGLPVGNVAFELMMRLTAQDRADLAKQTRYQMTALGLLDTTTGHLVNDEIAIQQALDEIRANAAKTVTASASTPQVLSQPA